MENVAAESDLKAQREERRGDHVWVSRGSETMIFCSNVINFFFFFFSNLVRW